MQEFDDTKAGLEAIIVAATEAKADATRQRGLIDQAVGLMQALNAKIGELAGQAGGATAADLASLRDLTATALSGLGAANTARDEADADLAAGTAQNTPAP